MDEDEDDYWGGEAQQPVQRRPVHSNADNLSGWMLFAEAALQALLKFLAAAADLVDRILGSPYPQQQQQQQQRQRRQEQQQQPRQRQEQRRQQRNVEGRSSLWTRMIRSAGSGIRNQFLGLTLVPQVVTILVLIICFFFSGYRSSFRLFRIVEEVEVPKAASSKRIILPDGRSIAYKEHGVSAAKAKHSGIILQGILSSKHRIDFRGVNETLLHQFGIRLVSYDLPGFGGSDPHPRRNFRTSAQDMALIADALGFGERFWLLVYSGGSPFAWAAIKYIPQRLAGVVMLGPVENPYKGELVDLEEEFAPKERSLKWRLLFFLARRFPSLARLFIDTKAISERVSKINRGLYARQADTETVLFQQREFIAFWEENLRQTQTMKQAGEEELPHLEELLRLLDAGWSWGFRWRWRWSFGFGRLGRIFGLRWLLPSFKLLPASDKREEQEDSSSFLFQMLRQKLFLVLVVLLLMAVVLRF